LPSRIDPKLRSFLLRLPLAGAAALALWFGGLAGPWARAVTATTEAAVRAVERPKATLLRVDDAGTIEYWRSDFSTRSARPAKDPGSLTSNLVLLLALLWATPGRTTGATLLRATGAVLLLFLSHVLHLVLTVETTWAMDLGAWSEYAYPRWQRELLSAGRYFFDIAGRFALPPFLWGFLSVVPRLESAREEETAEKENAAPRKGARRRKSK
jgi:hypothetical protein